VSNSSRELARIQPSVLIFTMLLLILGALLLVSAGIDPKAGERAKFTTTPAPTATPVDVFAIAKYTSWKSPDGTVQLEHPDTWVVQPDPSGGWSYQIASTSSQGESMTVFMAPTAKLGVQNAVATTAPAELLQMIFANLPKDQPPVTIHPIQGAGLNGAGLHQALVQTDSAGQRISLDRELWVLSLDPSHIFVIDTVTRSEDWPKMQPIFDHLISTLKIDAPAAVRVLESAPATAAATSPATAAATSAATQAAPGTPPATAPVM
jgi:hypothetical protein